MQISPECAAKFSALVAADDVCWPWQGKLDVDGYGHVRIGGRKASAAHRVGWFLATGIDPIGKMVCHHCDNPPCVNPTHLYLGDAGTNARDRKLRGRANPEHGESRWNSKLTTENIKEIDDLYVNVGLSQRAIADKYGVSQASVSLILRGKNWHRSNVGDRSDIALSRKRRGRPSRLSAAQKQQIIALCIAGESQASVAKQFFVSQQLVSLVVRRGT